MSASHVIVVTGAAGGIGNQIVRNLIEKHNANVVATDVVEGSLKQQKAVYGDKLITVIGDIVDPTTSQRCVELAVKHFGKLTGLALIAGVFGPCYRLENSPIDAWQKAININVLSHLNTLHYTIPELRKTKGRVVAATSGAGADALFSGWGFYGMSKAAVVFMIKQLHLEEPDISAVGISPGLCDTKMIENLRAGKYEGWTANDIRHYEDFVSKIDMITPEVAGNAYAQVLIRGDREISGLIVDYDDPRLPIKEHLKRKNKEGSRSYAQYSAQALPESP
ncbi:hypothetical protein EDB80DRAFT_561303 [Ilyonectria destructans]|nr:hypothetical protein EDB80DRAFT_561303 [Ilyonectria destructans]